MKYFYGIFLVLLISSCKNETATREDERVSDKPAQSDFMKAAQRDPRNYNSDCKDLFRDAKRMDSILYADADINIEHANEAIKAFTNFANYCTTDSLAPVFLIKTALVARSINNIPQAKLVLDKCIADYSKRKTMPEALFLLAQLYDEPGYLNSETEAAKLYKQIINEYPKSEWVSSAKGALKMIGKTDQEILEEITKKNK